jgi:hypothetical protein
MRSSLQTKCNEWRNCTTMVQNVQRWAGEQMFTMKSKVVSRPSVVSDDLVQSVVILGSESHGTHDHILLCQIQDFSNPEGQVPVFISPPNHIGPVKPPGTGFPFRHLLWLSGIRWRYLNPPKCGELPIFKVKVKVKVTLQLAVYRQSVLLGVKPLRPTTRDFFSTELMQ